MTASDIVVTRTSYDKSDLNPGPPIPRGDSFSVIVQLMDFRAHKLWKGGELVYHGGHPKGTLAITDLREEWRCHHLSPFDNIRFNIPFAHVRAFAEEMGRPAFSGLICPPGTRDDVVLGLAQAILPALENPQRASQLFVEQINLAMLTHLTQAYGGLYFPSGKKGVLAAWQEKQATEYLAEHINKPFVIADLAKACDLSRGHFINAFKQTFGRTPYRWLVEHRVGKAKEFLSRDMPIAEIAISCGFADQSHLTRVFSTIVGQSPGSWRKNHRKNWRPQGN